MAYELVNLILQMLILAMLTRDYDSSIVSGADHQTKLTMLSSCSFGLSADRTTQLHGAISIPRALATLILHSGCSG